MKTACSVKDKQVNTIKGIEMYVLKDFHSDRLSTSVWLDFDLIADIDFA